MSPGNNGYNYGAGTDLARTKYGVSFPELCVEFISAFSRAAKNVALYTLTHPMVTQSLGKAYVALGEVIDSEGGGPLVLSFQNDVWMFNDRPVPVSGPDSQSLVRMFKAHGLYGIRFDPEVRVSEITIVCEYLGSGARDRQAMPLNAFLERRGVANVRSEEAHYVREGAFQQHRQAPSVEAFVKPRPAESPAPESTPRPPAAVPRQPPVPQEEAAGPVPAPLPQRPRTVAPEPRRPLPAERPAEARSQGGGLPGGGIQGTGKGTVHGAGSGAGGGGQGPGGAGRGAGGGGQGAGSGGGGQSGPSVLGGMTLGTFLNNLVESAVKDPSERVKMYQDAMRMLKDGMSRQIEQATTELEKEKQKIQNSMTRTEQVLAQVADGKVVVDRDGRILMMNSAAEEISGRRLFEVVGKHVSEHLNPEEHILTLSRDMDLSTDSVPTGEVSVTGDEAVGGALRRSMALLEDPDGRVIGAYMTLPEVTKFKEAQRLQDEFLSKVTHDLQSPLASISSALEMLTDTTSSKLSDEERNFLAISIRNSQRLTEMIRGILDFSKLQAGKLPVHPEPVDLCPMINEAVDSLTPWARSKGLTLVLRSCAPKVRVMADHQRIVQVLTNLISNAVKSTPSGGSVMVAAARAATPDPSVVIGVRDTGPGIPKAELDRIFERFVQLESGGKREGVGLGLSIVQEFIALHKGRIWAESEEKKGTTFYFTLPMAPPGA